MQASSPAASPSCLVLAGAGDERCRRLARVEPGAHETDDVPIAAVLAQQIEGVPQEEMRRLRPGQRGMRRRQHPTSQVARRRRLVRQASGLDHRRGGDPCAPEPSQRPIDRFQARGQDGLRVGDLPGPRDGRADQRHGVVKDTGRDHLSRHWPQRGSARRVVAHPMRRQPESITHVLQLRRKIGDGRDRLQELKHRAGHCWVHETSPFLSQ